MEFVPKFLVTIEHLVVAYIDCYLHLKEKTMLHWCHHSKAYCTGKLVERVSPKVVTKDRRLHRIKFGSAKSKSNYGTISWHKIWHKTSDIFSSQACWQIGITFKKKRDIEYILDFYDTEDNRKFVLRSHQALLDCINFIVPEKKKKGVALRDMMQPEWKSSLESFHTNGNNVETIEINKDGTIVDKDFVDDIDDLDE
jgi:hypothetical protein